MYRLLTVVAVLGGLWALAVPPAAQAQQLTTTEAQALLLRPEAQAAFVPEDPLLRFRTRRTPRGRLDLDAGVIRAAYRLAEDRSFTPPAAARPETQARAYLQHAAAHFGLDAAAGDLVLADQRTGPHSHHLTFQQQFHGLPVLDRLVKVNLDAEGQPTLVLSGYAPHLQAVNTFNPRPALSAEAAAARVQDLPAQGTLRTNTPTLVVYPADPPRLAWHLTAWPSAVPAEWSVLVDAHTGEVFQVQDQALRRTGASAHPHTAEGFSSTPHATTEGLSAPTAALRRVDGTGFVFNPDPLSTSGAPYAPPYSDEGDQDTFELDLQRVLVDLRDITQGGDGLYRLEGPYVRVTGDNTQGSTPYAPPAESSPDGFRYRRSDDGFEAVMVYYHFDQSQRYVQELGFTDVRNEAFPVNPQGFTTDDSFYMPSQQMIAFGTGGVDDAEDAGVIWHEYAHALLDDVTPRIMNSKEGEAFHEGWADYWAASYKRSLTDAGLMMRGDWERVFPWDSGDGQIWPGRVLDDDGHYPEDIDCDTSNVCSPHDDGRLWATTMMEVYGVLGRTITDQLQLQSHRYLSIPITFADAAEAVVQADQDLFGGQHVSVLLEHFGDRGLVDPGAYGPLIAHDPLSATEQLGGTQPLTASVQGLSAPITAVNITYWSNSTEVTTVALSPGTGDTFSGELALPNMAGTVSYFIEALDSEDRLTVLPSTAPTQVFQFTIGPDNTAPELVHTPITQSSLVSWPAEVIATVTDRLDIERVWVDYQVEAPSGMLTDEGTYELTETQGIYRGSFPIPIGSLQRDSSIRYRISARDAAAAGNETVHPTDGWYTFVVAAEGLLRFYSFESSVSDVVGDGSWARATPTFGTRVAPSGTNVWATVPGGPYLETGGRASLELPAFNLSDLTDPVYLVFWHWYDTEHDGSATLGPDATEALYWDGGNVKTSTDGGQTWTLLTPQGGYPGTVIASQQNPMSDQPAFGGYSFGWRQAVAVLPQATDLRIRFDFGTDDSNTDQAVGYAGWYLDDVAITTIAPTDTEAPTVFTLPAARRIQPTHLPMPPVVVQADDDTGVARVVVEFEITTGTGRVVGSQRLPMSETDLRTFTGTIEAWNGLASGDQIAYRVRVEDFAGQAVTLPAPADPPLLIDLRLRDAATALTATRTTGLWRENLAEGFAIDTGAELTEPVSSLVLSPLDLSANAESITLTLLHRYRLTDGLGGNLKASTNGGNTWTVITPDSGYDDTFTPAEPHPMQDEPVLRGTQDPASTTFDLTAFAGQQLRLRLDLGTERAPTSLERWIVDQALLTQTTAAEAFEVPRTLALHPSFPNPFAAQTAISYTLPERLPVRLEVFDFLGRRVATLVDAEQAAGSYTVGLDGSRLSGGVYIVRLLAGASQEAQRIVRVH